ncbi:hypothetical protein B484DRAFT_363806 [Ochromonadaceae sp. CCMP2298]|nr:hypothetical protein B484DRAFT_363806 [Ochromonadaceae sp. CCMP2298]
MFIHFWGPKAGIHNDRLLLSQSGVNRILEDLQRLPGRLLPPVHLRFSCYTDRGYENHSFVSAAHHGILVTALQVMYNAIMSPARVCVEWGFGKLKNLSKLLQSADNTHLQGSNVDYHIQAAMLLCNANTCLHGAQATKLFACLPPTLESYFA